MHQKCPKFQTFQILAIFVSCLTTFKNCYIFLKKALVRNYPISVTTPMGPKVAKQIGLGHNRRHFANI